MRLTALISGALALTLTGCVSVLPEPTTPDALYRIEAAATPRFINATVVIREPEAPQIMSGRAMIREDSAGAIRLIPSVEWAGRSTRLMQLALVDSLVGDLGGAVLPESGVQAEYEVSTRLSTLGFVGDAAVCNGTVNLVNLKTRQIVRQSRIEARTSDSEARSAQTLKGASEACVEQIASFVEATLMDIGS
ncbi:MAG: ABC-type transport auxiliary lipoprotein family protein [Pseudomonadota bacterium]